MAIFASSMVGFLLGAWFAYRDGAIDGMCHVINRMPWAFQSDDGGRVLEKCEGIDLNEDMI